MKKTSRALSMSLAAQIYKVLVNVCGARDREFTMEAGPYQGEICFPERAEFCQEFSKDDPTSEYRFQGMLGFGGKFWHNNDRFYVSVYREDETPEIIVMVEEANKQLAELRKEYVKEKCSTCIWYSSAKMCGTCRSFRNHESEETI